MILWGYSLMCLTIQNKGTQPDCFWVQIATLQFTFFEGTTNSCPLTRQRQYQVMQRLNFLTTLYFIMHAVSWSPLYHRQKTAQRRRIVPHLLYFCRYFSRTKTCKHGTTETISLWMIGVISTNTNSFFKRCRYNNTMVAGYSAATLFTNFWYKESCTNNFSNGYYLFFGRMFILWRESKDWLWIHKSEEPRLPRSFMRKLTITC